MLDMTKILVTGAAGFVGFHLSQKLLSNGENVIGLDNLNNYYDLNLKQAGLNQLFNYKNFPFLQLCLADRDGMADLFAAQKNK